MDTNRPPDTLPANRSFGGGQIPPNPRSVGHRRSHSETFVRLPDDLLFDSDPDFNISDIDLPSLSDDNVSGGSATVAPAIPVEYGGRSDVRAAHPGGRPAGVGVHSRSMSVDAAFFGAMGIQEVGVAFGLAPEKRVHHRHSSSMDGETSPFEEESTGLSDYAKKTMSADKLAELALLDPKRAKRILANRQSAARSKERKILYTSELERKVQTLQTEATTLSAQVTLLQVGSTLNEALRGEVQRLKIATTQIPNGIENTFNRRFEQSISISSFYARPQQLSSQGGNLQAQQLHLTSPLLSSNGQSFSDHNLHDSMELM
ncbi:hypothetical protein KFK09_022353 [Dendrobium nobile]|uniref:BZIP domain-containing protein n=1 Tax=Dendrobium nobile TaxID=94219 RepID=A0A8T3AHM9_DENNO|nr:hypothetical protein KFK09_022353 [Dendrobium nobile]